MADEGPAGEQRLAFELDERAPDDRSATVSNDLRARVSAVRTTATRRTRERVSRPAPLPAPALVADEADPEPNEEAHERDADSLTIAEFYERVRRALAAEFTEEIWVTGEIRGLRESKGHHYIELADVGAPGGRGVAPQLEVACWARQWPKIARDLAAAGVDLEVGRVVRVRGQVSIWEGGSKLRFTLTALDVEALLGGIAAARRRLLLALEAEDLLEANRRLALGLVPLRVGLVTSPGSEGHRDFVGQLERSGFAFVVHLSPSLVQGAEAPAQLVAALRALESYELDLAVIVRGGGARGDLACFDTEEVARAIANASFPIWTGIGHTGDRSVADEVAHRACITPTACGEAIVSLVAEYWGSIERRMTVLAGLARARLDGAGHLLERTRTALGQSARHQLERRASELVRARLEIGRSSRSRLATETHRLAGASALLARGAKRRLSEEDQASHRRSQVLRAYDPGRQLERGWSLTRDEHGRLLRSVTELAPGARLVSELIDGTVVSVVEETTPAPEPRSATR